MLTLEAAIQDHRQRGNQGQFRLIDLGENGFSVAASRIRGISGVVGDTSLPLDVRISLAEIERTVPDTLSAIAQEVSARYGHNVTISPLIASLAHSCFEAGSRESGRRTNRHVRSWPRRCVESAVRPALVSQIRQSAYERCLGMRDMTQAVIRSSSV